MLSSNKIREDLEREVLGNDFGRFFDETLRRETALAEFDGPAALIKFLHTPSEEYGRKDAALCALLRAYQAAGPDRAGIGSLLLLILWPGLEAIVRSKRDQFKEVEDLWGEVHWAFLETAWRYPVERRPARVANNLKLDTLNRLCTLQRERCQHQDVVKTLLDAARREGEELFASPPLDVTTLDAPPPTAKAEDRAEVLARACDRAVEEGLISDLDRLLITATRIYGRELKAYAREHGLAYEMAKKRRQRAEQVVRRLLERKGRA